MPSTPPVPAPAPAQANDSDGILRARQLFEDNNTKRLVRDNRAEDWTPTEVSRKYKMFERLDPDFYAAVRVRYPLPNDTAD
ncbi:hypothetical protein CYMTET_32901 [Cymbomonas tetramitiformis]|uniref:Uncharacterized protein n=1 Tax=Cymbomonas tetramitiformis TaxID=36881 RepID=A0AAE0KRR5_9CHLO|nr:hypothetical protein CYMTET_32901 [Cymbomonas tetramitiformis]